MHILRNASDDKYTIVTEIRKYREIGNMTAIKKEIGIQ